MLRALLHLKRTALSLTLIMLLSLNALSPGISRQQAIILQYHHVSASTPTSTSITPQQFIKHLDLIESQKFQVLPLPQVMNTLEKGRLFKRKTVAITFDDGYLSIYKHAFPELKKRNLPFTIFISPQAIDDKFGNSLSWDQLKEMQKFGATIANHSFAHDHLLTKYSGESHEQWHQRITQDIQTSQARLQEVLGVNRLLFAYPYGEFNQAIKDLTKELGYLAFSQQSGPVSQSSDKQALPRFPASGIYARLKTLKIKLNSLAFNIKSVLPVSQILTLGEPAPALELRVNAHDIQYKQTQCFYMGAAIKTHVTKIGPDLLIHAQLATPLKEGRSRYNCTAPSLSEKHHYWYSMPFISKPVIGV
jgi:peptidoglycan/xylan/chitin deacetylase (PgdA/CDA1 family)